MTPDQVLDLWKWAKGHERILRDVLPEPTKMFRQVMTLCREYGETKSKLLKAQHQSAYLVILDAWRTIYDQMKEEQ